MSSPPFVSLEKASQRGIRKLGGVVESRLHQVGAEIAINVKALGHTAEAAVAQVENAGAELGPWVLDVMARDAFSKAVDIA